MILKSNIFDKLLRFLSVNGKTPEFALFKTNKSISLAIIGK